MKALSYQGLSLRFQRASIQNDESIGVFVAKTHAAGRLSGLARERLPQRRITQQPTERCRQVNFFQ